jgi:hypothetical protein
MPPRLRLMIYTCGGGHDALNADLPDGKINWLPSSLRRRMLVRGLSFKPDALIANGDQVYWDLRAPQASKSSGASAKGIAYAGTFDRPTRSGRSACPVRRRLIVRQASLKPLVPCVSDGSPRSCSTIFAARRRWPGRAQSLSTAQWRLGSRRA